MLLMSPLLITAMLLVTCANMGQRGLARNFVSHTPQILLVYIVFLISQILFSFDVQCKSAGWLRKQFLLLMNLFVSHNINLPKEVLIPWRQKLMSLKNHLLISLKSYLRCLLVLDPIFIVIHCYCRRWTTYFSFFYIFRWC